MKKCSISRRIVSIILTALICLQSMPALLSFAGAKQIVRIPYGFNAFLAVDGEGTVSGNDWEYEYVHATWAEAVEMLDSGEIDLLFPTNYSEERDKTMDYSAIPTGYTSVGIFTQDHDHYHYEDFASFDGARIACAENSTNTEELAAYAEANGFTYELQLYPTNDEIMEAVNSGKADFAVFSAANAYPGARLVAVFSLHHRKRGQHRNARCH